MSEASVRFFAGAASGGARKALQQLQVRDVMLSYATKNREPWDGIESLFIDSGGYSFLVGNGGYTDSYEEYLSYVRRVGADYYALRDYPCTPELRDKLNASVGEQQARTIARIEEGLEAHEERGLEAEPVAVLQGWHPHDYLRHIDNLRDRGLLTETVGIGSLVRENATGQIRLVIEAVGNELPNRDIHGFGVKGPTLRARYIREHLTSVDTQSYDLETRYAVREDGETITRDWREYALEFLKQRREMKKANAGLYGRDEAQLTIDDALEQEGPNV